MYITIVGAAVLIIAVFLPDMIRKKKDDDETDSEEIAEDQEQSSEPQAEKAIETKE